MKNGTPSASAAIAPANSALFVGQVAQQRGREVLGFVLAERVDRSSRTSAAPSSRFFSLRIWRRNGLLSASSRRYVPTNSSGGGSGGPIKNAEQARAVHVGPLQVVDVDDQRVMVGDAQQQILERAEGLVAQLARVGGLVLGSCARTRSP